MSKFHGACETVVDRGRRHFMRVTSESPSKSSVQKFPRPSAKNFGSCRYALMFVDPTPYGAAPATRLTTSDIVARAHILAKPRIIRKIKFVHVNGEKRDPSSDRVRFARIDNTSEPPKNPKRASDQRLDCDAE